MAVLDILRAVLAVIQALAPAIALGLIGAYGARQKADGAQSQVCADNASAAKTQAAIAAAEAQDDSPTAVVARLRQGSF